MSVKQMMHEKTETKKRELMETKDMMQWMRLNTNSRLNILFKCILT